MSGGLHTTSVFQPLDAVEKIPLALQLHQHSASSVVQERRTVKFLPSGPTTYSYSSAHSDPNQITFRMSDANNYLDPQSMMLHFEFKTDIDPSAFPAGAANVVHTVPDDGVHSIFNRARLSVNSVLIEDITDVNALTTMLLYGSGRREVYENQLGIMAGCWKHNTALGGGYTLGNVYDRRAAFGNMCANGINVAIPLSLLLGFARSEKYFPLRNAGSLELTLAIDNIANSMIAGSYTTPGGQVQLVNPSFSIKNVFLSVDMVTVNPTYALAMDRITTSLSENEGWKLPINTYLCVNANYMGSGLMSTKNVVFSKATAQLRSIILGKRPSNNINNSGAYSLSNFYRFNAGGEGSTGFQVRIGSDLYPQYGPAINVVEQYVMLQKAMNGGISMNSDGVLNLPIYCNLYGNDDVTTAFLTANCFDRILTESVDLDGYDSSVNGGIINVQLCDSAPAGDSIIVTAGLEYTRHIIIRGNQVQVIG